MARRPPHADPAPGERGRCRGHYEVFGSCPREPATHPRRPGHAKTMAPPGGEMDIQLCWLKLVRPGRGAPGPWAIQKYRESWARGGLAWLVPW